MLEVYNKERQKVAMLHNAFNMREEINLNAFSYFDFSLPFDDAKNVFCEPFSLVRFINYEGKQSDFYRILPKTSETSELGAANYKCEHVLNLLLDKVIFGVHIVGGADISTKKVIEYLLDKQETKSWVIDECDFNQYLEYNFENENIWSAIQKVIKTLNGPCVIKTNTNVYPYRLSIKKIDINNNPEMYVREGKNLLKVTYKSDPKDLCTRLYVLGSGEGINQLTIDKINNGLPYLESPKEIIDKYGIIERVFVGRDQTDSETLKAAAQTALEAMQELYEEYQVDYVVLGKDQFDVAEVGKIIEIVGYKKTYITKVSYNHDEVTSSTLEIANKPSDLSDQIESILDRQRVDATYSQGATQVYAVSLQTNCDNKEGLTLNLYIPDNMIYINKVMCRVELDSFRTYGKSASLFDLIIHVITYIGEAVKGSPKNFKIKVNNTEKFFSDRWAEIDITDMITDSQTKTITRGKFNSVTVIPDLTCYAIIDCTIQGYCQSYGDKKL